MPFTFTAAWPAINSCPDDTRRTCRMGNTTIPTTTLIKYYIIKLDATKKKKEKNIINTNVFISESMRCLLAMLHANGHDTILSYLFIIGTLAVCVCTVLRARVRRRLTVAL